MSESPTKVGGPLPRGGPRIYTPWSHLKKLVGERFLRRQSEVSGYLAVATPVALAVADLYQAWREAVEEPILNCQKAANRSAVYWWQVTGHYRRFEELTPPPSVRKYHRLFSEALRNASVGSEIAKNGFRFNKFSEVSRGMGYLDRYLDLMKEAEEEMGRLLRKYHLAESGGG